MIILESGTMKTIFGRINIWMGNYYTFLNLVFFVILLFILLFGNI